MIRTRYRKEIEVAAKAHGLDPTLVEAVAVQESSGNADAFRFEPDFWNRYLKLLPTYRGANPRRVSSSYSLIQIMYPVACERGFHGAPEELFIPEVGLEYGCRQLAYQWDWATKLAKFAPPEPHIIALIALAAYNGGRGGNDPSKNWPLRNAKYAREVLAKRAALDAEYRQL